MALQTITSNNYTKVDPYTANRSQEKKSNFENPASTQKNNTSVTTINNCYSSKSLSIEFSSEDGDKVSLSYEAIEFSQSITQLQTESDPEKIKELAKFIREEFVSMKVQFILNLSGDNVTDKSAKSQDIKNVEIPEYWNAENTSQRIVDFAVSFYGLVESQGEDYLNKVKAAIEDGFKQAREFLGELPEETKKLVDDTYDLVLQKLDDWAKEKDIEISGSESEVTTI